MTFSLLVVSSLVVLLLLVSFGGAGAITTTTLRAPDSNAFRSVGWVDLGRQGRRCVSFSPYGCRKRSLGIAPRVCARSSRNCAPSYVDGSLDEGVLACVLEVDFVRGVARGIPHLGRRHARGFLVGCRPSACRCAGLVGLSLAPAGPAPHGEARTLRAAVLCCGGSRPSTPAGAAPTATVDSVAE